MKLHIFLKDLEDLLQREEPCSVTDTLTDYEEWDSLSHMSVMAYFKQKFNIDLRLNDLEGIKTVQELISLSEGKIHE